MLLYLTDEAEAEELLGIKGLDMLTIIMLTTLVVISMCLLISVCACLAKARKIRKDAQNFVVPVNFDPTKVKTTASTGAAEEASQSSKKSQKSQNSQKSQMSQKSRNGTQARKLG